MNVKYKSVVTVIVLNTDVRKPKEWQRLVKNAFKKLLDDLFGVRDEGVETRAGDV